MPTICSSVRPIGMEVLRRPRRGKFGRRGRIANGKLCPASRSVSHVYPQAVSGTPISFSFDPASSHFHVLYVPNEEGDELTIIFCSVGALCAWIWCAQ